MGQLNRGTPAAAGSHSGMGWCSDVTALVLLPLPPCWGFCCQGDAACQAPASSHPFPYPLLFTIFSPFLSLLSAALSPSPPFSPYPIPRLSPLSLPPTSPHPLSCSPAGTHRCTGNRWALGPRRWCPSGAEMCPGWGGAVWEGQSLLLPLSRLNRTSPVGYRGAHRNRGWGSGT